MQNIWTQRKQLILSLGCLVILILLLAGCGGTGISSNSTASMPAASQHVAAGQAQLSKQNVQDSSASSAGNTPASAKGQQQNAPAVVTPQYLIKTLKVSINVKDTRKIASDLQTWISNTDPASSTAGADYEQVGDNLYNVSLSFSVRSTLYPQIYNYLRDYSHQSGGQLQSFTESVQDVTNDFVDTQSRLKNLRVEQQRLQTLLSQAGALSDVLAVQQTLTDVEGQIEQIEAHLNQLNSQVTFYTINVTLQPIETAALPPPPPGWNVGGIFHDAFSASLAFAQGLANFLIWLFAFSFYLVPAGLIIWLIWRVRSRPRRATPKPTGTTAPPATDD
jgi:hypothetical protein